MYVVEGENSLDRVILCDTPAHTCIHIIHVQMIIIIMRNTIESKDCEFNANVGYLARPI